MLDSFWIVAPCFVVFLLIYAVGTIMGRDDDFIVFAVPIRGVGFLGALFFGIRFVKLVWNL